MFSLTPTLRDAVERALALADGDTASALQRYARADASEITLDDVQLLSDALRRQKAEPPLWVHELLQGAAPVLPVFAQQRTPHPDLAPRLRALRAEAENREYAAMVGNVVASKHAGRDEAEMTTYRSSLMVGVNLIVSMATMFTVGYYMGGTKEEPHGQRALFLGLLLMLATMAVEMALFLIGASRTDAKVEKREKTRHRDKHDLTQIPDHYSGDTARQPAQQEVIRHGRLRL